jgi:SAM-dependent methyltransferase
MTTPEADERLERIRGAYQRRTRQYEPTEPWVTLVRQERERALVRWLRVHSPLPVDQLTLLDAGCGMGGNLLEFVRLGLRPERLSGVDLIPERIDAARRVLSPLIHLECADASRLQWPSGSFDVVFQSMMCSSILDDSLLEEVTCEMWRLVRPGGGVLWYDFTVDNPRNPDVRGLPVRRVLQLFANAGPVVVRRTTLAPPVARIVARWHPAFYAAMNALPALRTHVLCWLPKPSI